MAFIFGCEKAHLEFSAKKVFDAVTLGVNDGDRIGIVGGNGEGKSSLLKLFSGEYTPDHGRVTARGATIFGVLRQSDGLDQGATVAHQVVGDAPQHTWASNPQTRAVIDGLIGDIPWNAVVGELSGGQRRRVDLARVLVQDCDVLLLDEPTNHLDVSAIAWLANHLKSRWPPASGAFLVITHDRWFLDEVCQSMWEVHDGRVDAFEGGFSAYVLQRVERDEAARQAEQKRKNLMRQELAWLARGARARSSKPKFHLEAARALIANEPPLRNALELKQTAVTRLGKQVIDLQNVTKAFGGKVVINGLSWIIGPGDRLGILGENGAGKTTLLGLMQRTVQPSSGTVKVGQTVKMAVLSQHLDELEEFEGMRVRELLATYKARYVIDGREVTPAQLLERLGFDAKHLSAPVSSLSGGQRRRLMLMLILLDQPNVLILDELGNDLDTQMLAVVEDLLDHWPGTLILVTHDRYLMERVTDDQFALLDGVITHVPGGVDEYLQLVARRAQTTKPPHGIHKTAKSKSDIAAPTLSGAEEHALKKQRLSLERRIKTLEGKAVQTTEHMAQTEPSDYLALGTLEANLQTIKQQLSTLEDEWLALAEKLPS